MIFRLYKAVKVKDKQLGETSRSISSRGNESTNHWQTVLHSLIQCQEVQYGCVFTLLSTCHMHAQEALKWNEQMFLLAKHTNMILWAEPSNYLLIQLVTGSYFHDQSEHTRRLLPDNLQRQRSHGSDLENKHASASKITTVPGGLVAKAGDILIVRWLYFVLKNRWTSALQNRMSVHTALLRRGTCTRTLSVIGPDYSIRSGP